MGGRGDGRLFQFYKQHQREVIERIDLCHVSSFYPNTSISGLEPRSSLFLLLVLSSSSRPMRVTLSIYPRVISVSNKERTSCTDDRCVFAVNNSPIRSLDSWQAPACWWSARSRERSRASEQTRQTEKERSFSLLS